MGVVIARGPLDAHQSLSTTLRQSTREAHEAAENAPFMAALAAGHVLRDHYINYLQQLAAVYGSLDELSQQWRMDPEVGSLFDPHLAREGHIVADLNFFEQSPTLDRTTAATREYVDVLQQLARSNRLAAVAHHYVRYLGDLSGGQVVRPKVADALGLSGTFGLQFYAFDLGRPLPAYRREYRRRLHDLPLRATEIDLVVRYAQHAFALNEAMFDSLPTPEPPRAS